MRALARARNSRGVMSRWVARRPARCLDSVSDATIRKHGQPLEREAGAQRMAIEFLAALDVGGG